MRHKKFSSIGKDITNAAYSNKLYKTKRTIKYIILHCAATPVGIDYDAYDIDDWHLQRWGSGCGYHYIILRDGTIQKGRWADYSGAHARNYNKYSLGICYIGGVYKDNTPAYDRMTPEQKISCMTLINTLNNMYYLYNDLYGHSELPNVQKDCPCLSMNLFRNELEDYK